jgi:hypothetical protein
MTDTIILADFFAGKICGFLYKELLKFFTTKNLPPGEKDNCAS